MVETIKKGKLRWAEHAIWIQGSVKSCFGIEFGR